VNIHGRHLEKKSCRYLFRRLRKGRGATRKPGRGDAPERKEKWRTKRANERKNYQKLIVKSWYKVIYAADINAWNIKAVPKTA